MTDTNHNQDSIREDVLIGRVVDGEATASDWSALERLASGDDGLWRRIAQSQRDHARLEQAVEDEIAVAELVGLPLAPAHGGSVIGRIGRWGGWAVAAGLAFVMGAGMLGGGGGAMLAPGGPQAAPENFTFGPALYQASPDQAFDRYISAGMADGRVVAEMPAMLVGAESSGQSAGPGQVLIIRRVVERVDASASDLFQVKPNEHGRPVFVPAELPPTRQQQTDTF